MYQLEDTTDSDVRYFVNYIPGLEYTQGLLNYRIR